MSEDAHPSLGGYASSVEVLVTGIFGVQDHEAAIDRLKDSYAVGRIDIHTFETGVHLLLIAALGDQRGN